MRVCVCVFNCVFDFLAPVVFYCYFFSFPLQSLSRFICVVVVVLLIITDAVFVYSLPS